MRESRPGLGYGVLAYALWGLFPLYWPLLKPAGAAEILSHRIIWSLVAMGALAIARHRIGQLRAIASDRRVTGLLMVAATVVSVNWLTYIWAVNHGRVVEASLGYFINPLVTVLLGVFVMGERLRSAQWAALSLAGAAVVVLTIDYGRLPWVALILAFSFGIYGLAKKKANAGAVESLTFETALIAPLAGLYLAWLSSHHDSTFTSHGWLHAGLLVGAGLVTAVPLALFGAAAIRVSMVSLGLLQYLAPILQFSIGVWLFHEAMPTGRWIGFGLVWVALVLFTVELVSHQRRQLALAVESSAT